MSDTPSCGLCGGRLLRNKSTTGEVSDVRVCNHCDRPCPILPGLCLNCRKVEKAKNV